MVTLDKEQGLSEEQLQFLLDNDVLNFVLITYKDLAFTALAYHPGEMCLQKIITLCTLIFNKWKCFLFDELALFDLRHVILKFVTDIMRERII